MIARIVPILSFIISVAILYLVSPIIGIKTAESIKLAIAAVFYLCSILVVWITAIQDTIEQNEFNLFKLIPIIYCVVLQPVLYFSFYQSISFPYLFFIAFISMCLIYFIPAIIQSIELITLLDPADRFHEKYYDSLYSKSEIDSVKDYNDLKYLVDYNDRRS